VPLVEDYLKRGWHVAATERVRRTSKLHDLMGAGEDRLEIETVDIVYPDQVATLRGRLASRKFDLLFVNAGVKNDDRETIADVSEPCEYHRRTGRQSGPSVSG
jgi:NAD(P)-dependent dehydrogenase (short-subunit alcohol dehydrogenase family)